MADSTCEILEISLVDGEKFVKLALPPGMIPGAGQYAMGFVAERLDILSATLFYSNRSDHGIILCGEIPAGWAPGDMVRLRGPLGKGFHLPSNARRVGILPLSGQFSRLLPIIHTALAQNAAVSLFSERMPANLPSEVEVLPLDGLSEGWDWADYFAIEAPARQSNRLRELLRLGERTRIPCMAEILIAAQFPCGGIADCGVCAVKAGGRYKLACKDGPVFDLNSLEF